MRRLSALVVALVVLCPVALAAQAAPQRPRTAAKPHPLPVVGAARERFEAVDAVTIGDRIFVLERGPSGGWLRVYDASDVANPLELRNSAAPVVGRPLAIAGDGNRVLVASVTADSTRLRFVLFDVSRGDETRWSGAASLPAEVKLDGVQEMHVRGARAYVLLRAGPRLYVDLDRLERVFATATQGDEESPAARAMLRALVQPRTLLGGDAHLPMPEDTLRRDGSVQPRSFAFEGQLDAWLARRGGLIQVEGQWNLDVTDAATGNLAFTTKSGEKTVEPLVASDSGQVLVNDLVRVGEMSGRRIAAFNTNIVDPGRRGKTWTGVAFVNITDPTAPRVAGIDRRFTEDTSTLRYGWHPYVRDVVYARGAAVVLAYDSTWIARFDDSARVTSVQKTGRFAGRIVPGPDGTVLELSVEAPWRDLRRAPLADSTAPAFRIRTATPRLAMREGPAAISVDARGTTTVPHRLRFEIVAPTPAADPSLVTIAIGGTSLCLPAVRRGPLLEARIAAGTPLGAGVITLSLTSGGAGGRWIALVVPPVDVPAGATRGFVALADPFTNAAIVVADSATNASTIAAFSDSRIRSRLARDSSSTIFIVQGADSGAVQLVRRDRGHADIRVARGVAIAAYPSRTGVSALAAVRHLGTSARTQLSFCLRDALGKRVQQELDLSLGEQIVDVPCGDAAALRRWIESHGAAVVEGPSAAVVINRRHLPPVDPQVEAWRRKRWTRMRAEITIDTSAGWRYAEGLPREDSTTVTTILGADTARRLSPAEQREVVRALSDAALLSLIEYAATDPADSTIGVIGIKLSAVPLPDGDAVFASSEAGSIVFGDLRDDRFIPRWEAWSYGSRMDPALLDLDGDGVDEFLFETNGTDAKGHMTSVEFWAYDRAGRELTRQPVAYNAYEFQARPISSSVTDSEYCDSDCGGLTIGRPGPDGVRPIRTTEGVYLLRDGRYVLQPPPKVPPKPSKRVAPKRAPKKATR